MSFFTISRYCLFIIAILGLFACKKQTEEFTSEALADYVPLQPGKYITYRLDSTVFTDLGRTTEIHSYQEKHVIDAEITDNEGRPAFRVYRYLNDTTASLPWKAVGSYIITIADDGVQVTEDNLRIIKMHLPIRNGFTWKGNSFLPAQPYSPLYSFNNDDDMSFWEYFFDGDAGSFNTGTQVINDVYTIVGADEAINLPLIDTFNVPTVDTSYAARTLSLEKYAKNIGLIYREYILWDRQPHQSGNPPDIIYDPFKTGFGVKMWMIDHN
jgi:hypothetical protein